MDNCEYTGKHEDEGWFVGDGVSMCKTRYVLRIVSKQVNVKLSLYHAVKKFQLYIRTFYICHFQGFGLER